MNIGDRIYTDDGLAIVTNMFDIDGEETEVSDLAISVVAEREDGKWIAVKLSDLEPSRLH